MSKLKDKLTANMRMVKTQQEPLATKTVEAARAKPAVKPTAAPSKAALRVTANTKPMSGDISPSGSALFPSRVWPD